jgi:hypothetical protein
MIRTVAEIKKNSQGNIFKIINSLVVSVVKNLFSKITRRQKLTESQEF